MVMPPILQKKWEANAFINEGKLISGIHIICDEALPLLAKQQEVELENYPVAPAAAIEAKQLYRRKWWIKLQKEFFVEPLLYGCQG